MRLMAATLARAHSARIWMKRAGGLGMSASAASLMGADQSLQVASGRAVFPVRVRKARPEAGEGSGVHHCKCGVVHGRFIGPAAGAGGIESKQARGIAQTGVEQAVGAENPGGFAVARFGDETDSAILETVDATVIVR